MSNKITLFQAISAAAMVTFEFTGFSHTTTKEGKKVAILQLAEPIPFVRGSQDVEVDNVIYPVKAENAREIRIHQTDFENNDAFEWDPELGIGTYKSDTLQLDVSKRTGQVWLKKESFASAANTFRSEATNKRLSRYATGEGTKVPGAGKKLQAVDNED